MLCQNDRKTEKRVYKSTEDFTSATIKMFHYLKKQISISTRTYVLYMFASKILFVNDLGCIKKVNYLRKLCQNIVPRVRETQMFLCWSVEYREVQVTTKLTRLSADGPGLSPFKGIVQRILREGNNKLK
jgi:hypothetical protein